MLWETKCESFLVNGLFGICAIQRLCSLYSMSILLSKKVWIRDPITLNFIYTQKQPKVLYKWEHLGLEVDWKHCHSYKSSQSFLKAVFCTTWPVLKITERHSVVLKHVAGCFLLWLFWSLVGYTWCYICVTLYTHAHVFLGVPKILVGTKLD